MRGKRHPEVKRYNIRAEQIWANLTGAWNCHKPLQFRKKCARNRYARLLHVKFHPIGATGHPRGAK